MIEIKPIEISVNATKEAIDRSYLHQQQYILQAGKSDINDRIKRLKQLRSVFVGYRTQLQEAMYNDFHKPKSEVDLAEIFVVLNELNHTIRKLKTWAGKHRVGTPWFLFGASSYVHYEAKGHCMVVSPWNFPIQLTLVPLIHSFAAGNVTLIKPSEFTPFTIKIVRQIVEEVFSPEEAVIIEGDASVGAYLLSLKFNHIFFTGSPKIGKKVIKAAADHLCSVTLELGGKSPLIIDASADLELASISTAASKFINAGQFCISPDYIYIEASIKNKFVSAFIEQINYRFGQDDQARVEGDYSRIVNGPHFSRVSTLIQDAVDKGASILYGGKLGEKEYIGPTILENVTEDMSICSTEIFGPILYIKTFQNIQEVIDQVNQGEKPLALYLFSKNKKVKQQVRKEISAGGMGINTISTHYYNYNLPFGGVNNSGMGKAHGFYSFQEFSNAKGVFYQWLSKPGIMAMFPPFDKLTRRLIDLLIKIHS
ncbi:MAG: aldehyde dehydrogenase family protein [Saprospiraceae bacterium]